MSQIIHLIPLHLWMHSLRCVLNYLFFSLIQCVNSFNYVVQSMYTTSDLSRNLFPALSICHRTPTRSTKWYHPWNLQWISVEMNVMVELITLISNKYHMSTLCINLISLQILLHSSYQRLIPLYLTLCHASDQMTYKSIYRATGIEVGMCHTVGRAHIRNRIYTRPTGQMLTRKRWGGGTLAHRTSRGSGHWDFPFHVSKKKPCGNEIPHVFLETMQTWVHEVDGCKSHLNE